MTNSSYDLIVLDADWLESFGQGVMEALERIANGEAVLDEVVPPAILAQLDAEAGY